MSDIFIVAGAYLAGFLFYLFDSKPHVYRSKWPLRLLTEQSNMAYAAKICWLIGAVEFVYTRDLLTDACFLIGYGILLRVTKTFADFLRKRRTASAD